MSHKLTEQSGESPYILEHLTGEILLVGGYGVGNVGDEAILSGLLQNSSDQIDVLTVVTHDAEETTRLHRDELSQSTKLRAIEPSPSQLIKELYRNDSFVFGGGGLFSRYMGPYAAKIPYYAITATMMNKQTYWTALGVYSSTPTWTKRLLGIAMNRSESVTVRDQNSVEVLKEVGVDATLVDDAAIFLEPNLETGQDLLQSQGFSTDQPTVGIAGRRVLDETNNNRLWQAYNDFAEELEKRGYQLAFIPFCRHSYEKTGMDHQVCSQLAEEYDESKVLDYTHPDDLIDMISAMNGIIATRLHSMVFAYLSDTPFVAVEYADKVSSLLDQYGKRDQGISLEAVSGDRILEIFDEALDQQ